MTGVIITFLAEPDLESRSPCSRVSVILKLHLHLSELFLAP